LSQTSTPIPSPSVLTLGSIRIVVDHSDDREEAHPGSGRPPAGDEVEVSFEQDPSDRKTRRVATRILGSDVIAAAMLEAKLEPKPDAKPSDPARTRILDMNRLLPELER